MRFLFEIENEFPYTDFKTVTKMEIAGKIAIAKHRIESLLNYPDAMLDVENALTALKVCQKNVEDGEQARFRHHWKDVVLHVARIKAAENIWKRLAETEKKTKEKDAQ